ncbi:hypothetical protein TUBRATIS_23050 [Tubulinosema ratisbonensis]|uniref:Uncharacterized protein n=1 Tax=Tubulinosema ratisbonensis TaxID=291195 RepID=A0A437AJA4_9MICR|nr:hypothetical protein TUBRATIS_23050 [Tubulinosema ratisbonensis]
MDIKNNKGILFICSFTFLSIGFINGLTNTIDTLDKGFLSFYGSLPNIGVMVGLVIQQYLQINLKYLVVTGCLIHAISFYLEIFVCKNFILFLRFCLGLSFSFFMVCCTVYIEKLSLKKEINFFNSFSGSCGSIGLLICEGFSAFLKVKQEYYLYFFSFIFFVLFAFSFFLPDLQQEKSNFDFSCTINLLCFFLLLLIQQFTFVNCILSFSKRLFVSNIKNLSFYLALLNLTSNFVCVLFILLTNTPYLIYFTSLFLSSICLALLSINHLKNVLLFFLIFFYSCGTGPLTWTVISKFMRFEVKKEVYVLGNIINSFVSFLFVYFYVSLFNAKCTFFIGDE